MYSHHAHVRRGGRSAISALAPERSLKMRIALASLSLLCFVATGVRADDEEKPCTTHFKGKFYDLNPLKSKYVRRLMSLSRGQVLTGEIVLSSKDYHVIGTDEEIFPINVCQPVKTETFGIKDGSIRDSEVASFLRREHGDFVIGCVYMFCLSTRNSSSGQKSQQDNKCL